MYHLDITVVLDSLVKELRGGGKDVFQKAAFYLPSIRNEMNISVIVGEIIASPQVFPSDLDPARVVYLVDGFRSSAMRKAEITDPTVSPAKWADLILRTCQAVAAPQEWKTLPVIAGLLLARNKLGEQIVSGKLRAAAEDMFVGICGRVSTTSYAYVAYYSLAKAYAELDPGKFAKLNHSRVLVGTLLMICRSDKGLNYAVLPAVVASGQSSNPVFTLWSGFSHLIKACIERLTPQDFNVLDEALNYMLDFVELLSESALRAPSISEGSWQVLKLSLFGIMIQLQGYCTLMLTAKRKTFFRAASQPVQWGYFAAKIIRCLSPIYFIVLHLSGSGFTAYDFVYYTCLDSLLESPSRRELAHITRTLAGSINIGSLNSSVVNRGRIVYMLDFFEAVVPYLDDKSIQKLVLPIAREFWVPGANTDFAYFQPVLESAHSVMLAYLTTVASAAKEADVARVSLIDSLVPEYLQTILSLFPDILSPVQLNLALVSMVHVVTSPVYRSQNPAMADLLMDKLLIKCHQTPSGIELPNVGEDNKDAGQQAPPTTRAVLGSALIHAIPFVEDVAKLEQWLDSAQLLIVSSGTEQSYLRNELWKMVSGEVSLALADTAIRWWYSPKL